MKRLAVDAEVCRFIGEELTEMLPVTSETRSLGQCGGKGEAVGGLRTEDFETVFAKSEF